MSESAGSPVALGINGDKNGPMPPRLVPRAGGEVKERQRTSGGQREGRQAREPSIKSFLLPRLRRKGKVQPAASKAGAPEGPAFLFFSLQGEKRLQRSCCFSSLCLGAGRPPPTEPPSHKLPAASCLGARSPHGSEDHWAPLRSRARGCSQTQGLSGPPTCTQVGTQPTP